MDAEVFGLELPEKFWSAHPAVFTSDHRPRISTSGAQQTPDATELLSGGVQQMKLLVSDGLRYACHRITLPVGVHNLNITRELTSSQQKWIIPAIVITKIQP